MAASIELVLTPPAGADLAALDRIDALRLAFARGPVHIERAERAGYWFRRFGIARAQDWPAAPLRAGAGTTGHLLCADPVHLAVSGDAVALDAGVGRDLDDADAAALLVLLNAHFAADGWRLFAAGPGQWLLEAPAPIDAVTTPPADAHGRSIEPFLPQGREARILKRAMNEAQMLLFDCAVNASRQARGQAPINGLWLWGGAASLPPVAPAPGLTVLSAARHIQEMARRAGAAAAPLPHDAAAMPPASGRIAVDLDFSCADAAAWLEDFAARWLQTPWRGGAAMQLDLVLAEATLRAALYRRDPFSRLRRGSLSRRLADAGLEARNA